MSRIRTLFFGTPPIAKRCLEALIKDEHFEIVGVVTQPDRPAGRGMKLTSSPVKSLAEPLGITVMTPENVNKSEVLSTLENMRAEVAIVVAYGQILKPALLDLFPQKIVNLHASLLPRWRGAAPIQRALMEGDRETGVSLQIVVPKLDAGPVLGERRFVVSDEMTSADVFVRCEQLGVQLLTVDLMDYLRGNLSPQPQDESRVTYAHKIQRSEARIDWARSAEEIHNQVRGLYLGPMAETEFKGRGMKVHRTRVRPLAKAKGKAGTVIEIGAESMLVQCGEGGLELLEVQPESRAKMSTRDFLRGYATQVGDQFATK